MNRPTVTFEVKANINCPCCGNYVDLLEHQNNKDDAVLLGQLFDGTLEYLEGLEVTCPECDRQFDLDGGEW